MLAQQFGQNTLMCQHSRLAGNPSRNTLIRFPSQNMSTNWRQNTGNPRNSFLIPSLNTWARQQSINPDQSRGMSLLKQSSSTTCQTFQNTLIFQRNKDSPANMVYRRPKNNRCGPSTLKCGPSTLKWPDDEIILSLESNLNNNDVKDQHSLLFQPSQNSLLCQSYQNKLICQQNPNPARSQPLHYSRVDCAAELSPGKKPKFFNLLNCTLQLICLFMTFFSCRSCLPSF